MILAFDIGATYFRVGLGNKSGFKLILVEKSQKGSKLINQILEKIFEFNPKKVSIAIKGSLDLKKGKILNSLGLRIKNFEIVKFLERKTKKKIFLINDCLAGALGEKIYGSAKEYENFVYLNLGSGIGAGIFVDGKLLVGKDGNAHEVGHMIVDVNKKMECTCGKKGHWEAYCSGIKLVEFVEREIGKKLNLTVEKFFELRNQEPFKKVFKRFVEFNVIGISNLINLYDPESIIFNGGIILNNKFLISLFKKQVENHVFNRMPKFEIAKLKEFSPLYGALAFAFKQ
jgi:glucokinase